MPYVRKTQDEYQIHGHYAHGWEEVTAADTWKEARQLLKDYRDNEPGTPFKVIKRRVKVAA